jgi:hypothetical protein
MNVYPFFPYFLMDLGEISYKESMNTHKQHIQ